jgi:putative transposase
MMSVSSAGHYAWRGRHHSDRGSQYAAAGCRKVLGAGGMIQSMHRKGNCWDNAPAELWH